MSGYGTDAHAVRFGVPCTVNGYGVEVTPAQGPPKCYVNGETVNVAGNLLDIGVFGDFKATLCRNLDGKDPIKTISGFPKNSGGKYVDLAATEPKITASDIKSIIIIGSRPKFPSQTPEPKKDNNDKESGDFLLEIKMENKTINQRVFPSNYFHPKVRFTVDIRPSLNRILDDLVDILSSKDKNLNTKYLGYNLC